MAKAATPANVDVFRELWLDMAVFMRAISLIVRSYFEQRKDILSKITACEFSLLPERGELSDGKLVK